MIDAFLASDWFTGAMRILFVGGIYLFLFLVVRATARDLVAVARGEGKGVTSSGKAALVVVDGSGSGLAPGAVLPVVDDTIIGREAGLPLVLDDPHVSAHHAELQFRHDQWWLRDLDSSNGTTLNGQPVHSVVAVRSGDVLQCAGVRLRFITPFLDAAEIRAA